MAGALKALTQLRPRTWIILVGGLLVILYAFTILDTVSTVRDGQRIFWLDDDMMISMNYGRSLAKGTGLVWYPGAERVEGYSNLGWVLVMAAVHLLPLPSTLTSLPILIINVALAVFVLLLTARLSYRLASDAVLVLPIMLLALTVSYDLAYWTIYGLEITLQSALFLWLLLRTIDEAEAGRPKALTFLLTGLLGIVRVDGVLFIALICFLAFWANSSRRDVLRISLLSLLIPLAHALFRMAYYGWPLPNTYYLKLAGWPLSDRLPGGFLYVKQFANSYGILWIVSGIGAWFSRLPLARALWLMGIPLCLYAIYAGGDFYDGARFFASWLPIVFALAFLTPHWLGWRMPSYRAMISLSIGLGVVVIYGMYPFMLSLPSNPHYPLVGLALKSATRPESTIAVQAAGSIPYFSERRALDLLGKNDAIVAHQPSQPHVSKPGHNKYDYEKSLALFKPDVIVPLGWPPIVEKRAEGGKEAAAHLGWRDGLFFAPEFQEHYVGSIAVVKDILPIFVRSDSPERLQLTTQSCEATNLTSLTTLGIQELCPLAK